MCTLTETRWTCANLPDFLLSLKADLIFTELRNLGGTFYLTLAEIKKKHGCGSKTWKFSSAKGNIFLVSIHYGDGKKTYKADLALCMKQAAV